jgi:type VI secretion system secreted protein Hcp
MLPFSASANKIHPKCIREFQSMKTLSPSIRFGLLAAIALALAPSCFGQYNILLRIDGLTGESTVVNHVGDIGATAFSFGVTGRPPPSPGSPSGPPIFTDLSVTKFVDKTSPTLVVDSASARSILGVILFVQATAPTVVDSYKVTLLGVYVTSVNSGGVINGRPTETVTFKFNEIRIQYTPINPDGSLGAPVTSCVIVATGGPC